MLVLVVSHGQKNEYQSLGTKGPKLRETLAQNAICASSNQPTEFFKNNQSDRHELADRINTTDWEGGTGPRTCSNDMHGHGVTMERHTMTIFYFALQIKHFKYSLSGQLVAIG